MDEEGELNAENAAVIADSKLELVQPAENIDEAIDVNPKPAPATPNSVSNPLMNGEIRTLDGDIAGDEFASDAINYQILLGKIDALLDRLKLDA